MNLLNFPLRQSLWLFDSNLERQPDSQLPVAAAKTGLSGGSPTKNIVAHFFLFGLGN